MKSFYSFFRRFFFAVSIIGSAFCATPEYTAVDLGSLAGGLTQATGINDAGQVVGNSVLPSGATHAFLYSGGTLIDLGTLGGSASAATAINALGAVVGYSMVAGDGTSHAFLYSGGSMVDLGTLGAPKAPPTGSTRPVKSWGPRQLPEMSRATRSFIATEP